LPILSVAGAVWIPRPNLKVARDRMDPRRWSASYELSQALTAEHLQTFAEIAGIESLRISKDARLDELKNELKWNKSYYLLRNRN